MLEERYSKAIKRLLEDSAAGIPIIAEGRHDEAVLRDLGAQGPIVLIQGNPIFKVAESIGSDEAIVLTDFDRRGAEYNRWLKHYLERNGVKANTELRKQLFGNSSARTVEELKPPEERRKEYGKNRHDNNKVHDNRKAERRWRR